MLALQMPNKTSTTHLHDLYNVHYSLHFSYEKRRTCFVLGVDSKCYFPLSCTTFVMLITRHITPPPPIDEDDSNDEEDSESKVVYIYVFVSLNNELTKHDVTSFLMLHKLYKVTYKLLLEHNFNHLNTQATLLKIV